MRISHTILATLFVLVPTAQAKEQAVEPGKEFSGSILNITAPNSEGWKLIESSDSAMVFAHGGNSRNESFIAAVLRIPLPEAQSKDDFLALIKHDVEQDAPPDRFKNIESTFEYSDQRGYACVLYKATTEDTKAKTPLFTSRHLILQVQTLYCRLPNVEKAGFAASYSHRGPTKIDDFDALAADFIKGIQVPNG